MFQSNINVYSYVSVMVHMNTTIVNNVEVGHLTQITFRTFCMYTLVVVTVSILVSDIIIAYYAMLTYKSCNLNVLRSSRISFIIFK